MKASRDSSAFKLEDPSSEILDYFMQPQNNQLGLSCEDSGEISNRGYEVIEEIGEGHTRKAFRVRLNRGNVSRKAVMKVPLKEVDTSSVCTIINKSKGNLDIKEVNVTNELVHPNIIRVLDSFQLSDGRTVNVEDDIQGTDLETLVRTTGAIRDQKVLDRISSQLFDAVGYAHNKSILHRDIKPSNFYLQKDGRGMLGDWQTAAKVHNIEDTIMPTRGGTQYTSPSLLNAVLTGRATCATPSTDVYSTAATLYYAITGEDAFKYKIVQDESGKDLRVGDKTLKIKLKDDSGESEDQISPKKHKENVKKAVSKLPRRYRSFFKRAFSMDERERFYDAEDAAKYWKKTQSGSLEKLKDNLIASAKYALPAILASGITAATIYGVATRDPEPKPTMRDILMRADYTKFSLDTQLNPNSPEWSYNSDAIALRIEDAKKNLEKAESKFTKDTGFDIKSATEFARNIHLMDKRLVSSWVRACYLANDPKLDAAYKSEGSERISEFLVPKKFLQMSDRYSGTDVNNDRTAMAFGVMYLKQNLGNNKTVADVFADYFCSREEVLAAKTRTQSQEYLATAKVENEHGGTISRGYRLMIDPRKEKLISTAIGLYAITDEEGKIDWNKAPKRSYRPQYMGLPDSQYLGRSLD